MQALKATLLDDDAFRLLAIPFGGPIPSPHTPLGVDLDGEWFDKATDLQLDRFTSREVDWHHGKDATLKSTTIGKAVDPVMDDDGLWVTVWLNHGERRIALIKELAERGAQLFGSSQSIPGEVVKAGTGHIDVWPYFKQTLSTSPQNTLSVMRPMKAALGAPIQNLHDLAADLRATSSQGEPAATAGLLADELDELDVRALRVLEAIKNR